MEYFDKVSILHGYAVTNYYSQSVKKLKEDELIKKSYEIFICNRIFKKCLENYETNPENVLYECRLYLETILVHYKEKILHTKDDKDVLRIKRRIFEINSGIDLIITLEKLLYSL